MTAIGGQDPRQTGAARGVRQLELGVQGMTCTGCEGRIARALGRLDGIRQSAADHQSGQVKVVFDAGRTSEESVRAAIAKAGYEVVS